MNEEELLNAWLKMSLFVRGNRILDNISLNEMSVFNVIYDASKNGIDATFSYICKRTSMLKSQLNRVLGEMQKKNYIIAKKSTLDARSVIYIIDKNNESVYLEEHARVIRLVEKVVDKLGEDNALVFTKLLNDTTDLLLEAQKGE